MNTADVELLLTTGNCEEETSRILLVRTVSTISGIFVIIAIVGSNVCVKSSCEVGTGKSSGAGCVCPASAKRRE